MASMRRGSGAFVKACRPTLDPMARKRAMGSRVCAAVDSKGSNRG